LKEGAAMVSVALTRNRLKKDFAIRLLMSSITEYL
jgi:hypothetical protein